MNKWGDSEDEVGNNDEAEGGGEKGRAKRRVRETMRETMRGRRRKGDAGWFRIHTIFDRI